MTPARSGRSVLFDTGPLGTGSHFTDAERIIEAWHPGEVEGALATMETAQASGKWLAGSASYELGYALLPELLDLLPGGRREPLLRFGVFDGVRAAEPFAATGVSKLSPLHPEWNFADYEKAFRRVHDYIGAGDIYQANLTFPLIAQHEGCLYTLYDQLQRRQSVPYGAFVDLGETKLLSRSPELFFSLSASGQLCARPMKGTAPRSTDPERDAAAKTELAQSEKNQAENLMITDLLRNDFGRIARIGSVRVPKLFAVETYATVHQMVSEITAELLPGKTLRDIFAAVFPCGSITGAPKIRAMQILSDLETAPRGSYCGAIGWIAPDGRMEFSVAIRTLICEPTGRVTLNVGGGIVHDSTARGEYDEALLKSRFARDLG